MRFNIIQYVSNEAERRSKFWYSAKFQPFVYNIDTELPVQITDESLKAPTSIKCVKIINGEHKSICS